MLFYTTDNEELLNLALVQYAFDDMEHSVVPRPHGNSKTDSYIHTMPSTLHKLKKVAVNLTPKFAVCVVSCDVVTAPSAGSLVRNRQVKDFRRRKDEGQLIPVGKAKDPLFSVMLMCKESHGANASDAFIRIVTCAPEPMPMAVLASDWTLNDLDRFCTKQRCTVFCIDPTFSLGDFSVTVATYRHLMLHNSDEKCPVMMGPILLSAIKAWVSVGCTVFTDNLNAVYFSISTSYELLLCINRKFDLHPFL